MADPREKQNASQFPKVLYARHMQPGTCGYDSETILVDTDALKSMLPSAVGKPVFIHHQDVELDTLKEKAGGYITDAFYNELDGWGWFKIILIDDDAHEAREKNWSVSNAYIPTQWGPGGTKNNVPFQREVLAGEFTHLAIVPNPRYEGACIMSPEEFRAYQESKKARLAELQNSKTPPEKGNSIMFNLFKREKVAVASDQITEDTMVEIKNAKGEPVEVSIKAMTEALLNAKKNADEDDEAKKKAEKEKAEKENGKQMCNVGGEEMPLDELINRFQKLNAEADERKKADEKANADKDDDEDEDEDKGEKGEKKNAADKGDKHFEELRNAHNKGAAAQPIVLETSMDQMKRGKERYGKQPAA